MRLWHSAPQSKDLEFRPERPNTLTPDEGVPEARPKIARQFIGGSRRTKNPRALYGRLNPLTVAITASV